jgi:hypothetical protein
MFNIPAFCQQPEGADEYDILESAIVDRIAMRTQRNRCPSQLFS